MLDIVTIFEINESGFKQSGRDGYIVVCPFCATTHRYHPKHLEKKCIGCGEVFNADDNTHDTFHFADNL